MMQNAREIGRVQFVQVQRDRLKIGQKPDRYYDPAALMVVEALRLTPDGVIGLTASGVQIVDVHHAAHPHTRHRPGINGMSLGFTAHYREMRARFGDHLVDGIAGENVIIAVEEHLSPEMLSGRLAMRSAQTGQLFHLTGVLPIPPCSEFSHFAAGGPLPPEALKDVLQFLDDGRRGFYALLNGQDEAIIRAGDVLLALE